MPWIRYHTVLLLLGTSLCWSQQKKPSDSFRTETIQIPTKREAYIESSMSPEGGKLGFRDQVQEIVELCEGVTPGFAPKSCFRVSDNGTQLFCNTEATSTVLIRPEAGTFTPIPPNLCLYDCKKPLCRTNEIREQPESPALHPYRIDAFEMEKNPKYPKIVKETKGVIALRASLLGRNWDQDSTDGTEWGEGRFDTFRIRVVPKSELTRWLPDFDLESKLTTQNQSFIYDHGENAEKAREELLTAQDEKISFVTYPNIALLGAYLNRKSGWHWLMETLKGEPAVECEHAGCDQVGPQALVYEDKTYGIASWENLKNLKDSENLVFIVVTGDGGPTRNDLIAFFQIPMLEMKKKQSFLLIQNNPKGGTDLVLMFDLELNPVFR